MEDATALGMSDAPFRIVKRAMLAKSEIGTPIAPLPLIPIGPRKRSTKLGVKTRIGIGDSFVDHAAGTPLRARSSAPDWGTTRSVVQTTRNVVTTPRRLRAVDAPVELPLNKTWIVALTILALLFVPACIAAVLFFASRPSSSLPPEAPPARAEVVAAPGPQQVATPEPAPAAATVEAAVAPLLEAKSAPAKRRIHAATKAAPRIEVRRRAAPAGLPKSE